MSEAGILLGDYGNGTIGLKASIPGFDVRDLSQDDNSNARSINSNWSNLCKIKLYGVAVQTWTRYQEQTVNQAPLPNGDIAYFARSISGWRADPTPVATGLTYIPIWEERTYNTATKLIYDDNLYAVPIAPSGISSFSGARSYFSGPGLNPNLIWFEPIAGSSQTSPIFNINASEQSINEIPPYPPFPAYPPNPSAISQRSIYIIYSNKLGDVA